MNSVYKSIEIDLYSPTSYEVIKAQQGDKNSRILEFTLYNQGEPYVITEDISLKFMGHRGDGSYFLKDENDECISFKNNKIIVSLTDDVLYYSGMIEAKLAMYDNNGNVLSTVPFKISCIKSPCDENDLSKGERSKIEDLIFKVDEFYRNAEKTVSDAKDYAEAAYLSARNASTSENAASLSEVNAKESEKKAKTSLNDALESEQISAENAMTTLVKAAEADTYAKQAQSYAVGTNGEVRENDMTDCARHYYEQSKDISESLSGALKPMGTVTFAELIQLTSVSSGDMYNISDQFTTTPNFKEGSGCIYPVGTNVYRTADGYWDCLAGTMVTSVNGRKGDVNLTADDIGAYTKEYIDDNLLLKTGTAANALKATQDGNGNVITSTYALKNAVMPLKTSATKIIALSTSGTWYRLGYVQKKSELFGTFTLMHTWSNNPSAISKFEVGVSCSTISNGKVTEIFYAGDNTARIVKQVKLTYVPIGTVNGNIYVDVFIQGNSAWHQGNNGWYYHFETEESYKNAWLDSNFSTDVSTPSGTVAGASYTSQIFTLTSLEETAAKANTAYNQANSAYSKANAALPLTGGTLTGNLTVKNGTSNYGSKINLGDGDYVHISEPTDDCMEIKAKKVNFVLSDSTSSKFTINGGNPFAGATIFNGHYNSINALDIYIPSNYMSTAYIAGSCNTPYFKAVRLRISGLCNRSGYINYTLNEEILLGALFDCSINTHTSTFTLYLKDSSQSKVTSASLSVALVYGSSCGNYNVRIAMSSTLVNTYNCYITKIDVVS